MNALPLWTLAGVLTLIAVRRVGRLRLAIWQIMSLGALVVFAGGAIRPADAWAAIDWEVIGFLFGVFLLGQALVESGWLAAAGARVFGRVAGADSLLLAVLFLAGLGSAVLMNDTLAVIGTPLALAVARDHRLPPSLMLLALAFGITIGSVMSPIGNPQNLLIALAGGFDNPFLDFLTVLGPPTLLNLLLAYGILKLFYRDEIHGEALTHVAVPLRDLALARLARAGLLLLLVLIGLRVALALTAPTLAFPLVALALGAAAPLALSPRRLELLKGLDWHTLVFFAAMFVLMRSVWDTGLLQSWMPPGPIGLGGILAGSTIGSQLVSNVPLVALALPLLRDAGPETLLALAAGATVAGNLTLIGAASNVIIVQAAERRGSHLGFWRFLAVGAPLTALNLGVYWMWLGWVAPAFSSAGRALG